MENTSCYIYKLTLAEDTGSYKAGAQYIGQHNGKRRKDYITGGVIPGRLIKKYGKHIFNKEILMEGVFNRMLLDELEKHYIRLYNTNALWNPQRGLNLNEGGTNGFQQLNWDKRKKVYQYSLAGEYIREWASLKEAAASTNTPVTGVTRAVKGEINSSGGFRWTSEKYIDGIEAHTPSHGKPVYQFDMNGKLLKRYASRAEAGRCYGDSRGTSINTTVNNLGSYKGYLWASTPTYPKTILSRYYPIMQCNPDGTTIRYWSTAKEAAEALSISVSRIYNSMRNQHRLPGGYLWRRSSTRDIKTDN